MSVVKPHLPVGAASAGAAAVPPPRASLEDPPGGLSQRVTYPERGMAVLTLRGPVDAATAPRLAEMLHARLCSQLARLVLDLSGVEFLGVAGIRTLVVAELRARAAEAELQLACGGNREVTRTLTATVRLHQLRWHAGPAAPAALAAGGYWARCTHPYSPTTAGPAPTHWPGEV